MENSVGLALFLTVLAGLSTGVGSAMAWFARRSNTAFLAGALGFSAGVMIYVSFVELLAGAQDRLADHLGVRMGGWVAAGAFFGGVLTTVLIDAVVPVSENPHQTKLVEELDEPPGAESLRRVGLLTALAIGIHNFPEGLATFMSALSDPTVGVSIAIAIALHNIPEGISVSVPVYYATGSRKKAFWYSFLSGVSEPIGAVLGYLVLRPFLSEGVLGIVLAAVAGVMVFISLDQLIPNAKKYDEGHISVYGLVGGMAVMALTLLVLQP